MTPPTLSVDEAADLLQDLLAKDVAIEELQWQVAEAKAKHDDLKASLKEAIAERDRLSREIRNPPPLLAGAGDGRGAKARP